MAGRLLRLFPAITLTAACAGTRPVPAEIATASRDIQAAAEAGARRSQTAPDPQSAYHLELAERALARARMLEAAGDVVGAEIWASRASADATLARMLAVEASTRAAAQRAEDQAQSLSHGLDAPPAPPPAPREPR